MKSSHKSMLQAKKINIAILAWKSLQALVSNTGMKALVLQGLLMELAPAADHVRLPW